MTPRAAVPRKQTGPLGPVLVSGLAILLLLSPLLRGGNRSIALLVLVPLAALLLAGLALRLLHHCENWRFSLRVACLGLLLLAPAWLALIYLTPLPLDMWAHLGDRAFYATLAATAGMPLEGPLPLSLAPDLTEVSLLAGVPVATAFLGGLLASRQHLRWLAAVVLVSALLQVVLALLQAAGGTQSTLFFGVPRATRPVGTFANPNHLANYLALAFALYIWFARAVQGTSGGHGWRSHSVALWLGGALFFVVGIVMTLSRGAALSGLPMALAAGCLVAVNGRRFSGRMALAGAAVLLAAGLALLGLDALMARTALDDFVSSAADRNAMASSSWTGAMTLWPWGAGWGTFDPVYARFQPHDMGGVVNHAHHDYVEMLLEGGIFFVLIAAAAAFLILQRAVLLVRAGFSQHRLSRDELLCAIAGLGLLGFLLHSLVEFSMRIPANAILAALLAGMYLRPLDSGTAPP